MNRPPAAAILPLISALLVAMAAGCTASPQPLPVPSRVLILVPGVQGDVGYGGLRHAVIQAGIVAKPQTFSWGAPLPLWFLNLQTRSIHDSAEEALSRRLVEIAASPEHLQINLIGHSAGCGVILGALGRLPQDVTVADVILLAPSVSPAYDLQPALTHIRGHLHVFFSENDRLFLSWRTSTFGTYDNIKTPAAGNRGFNLIPAESSTVTQHPYDPAWKNLGNDGDHFGTLAEKFDCAVIAPLLAPK